MSYYGKRVGLEELEGKTIEKITGLEKESEQVHIHTECGQHYMFYHEQDCCEAVWLEDYEVSSSDLVGGLILSVTEESNEEEVDWNHITWTFYKVETNKGGLWMRWCGESNGYYSEDVDLVWINKPKEK